MRVTVLGGSIKGIYMEATTESLQQGRSLYLPGSLLLCLVLMFAPTEARAITVSFSDFQDFGITVSGGGGAGVGLPPEASRLFQYGIGDIVPSSDSGVESIALATPGVINSITVQPTLRICTGGTWASVNVPFTLLSYFVPIDFDFHDLAPNGSPVTFNSQRLTYESTVEVRIAADMGEEVNFVQYREANSAKAQQILMDFSVLSVDYTPNNVPDAAETAGLLAIGLVFLFVLANTRCFRRELVTP